MLLQTNVLMIALHFPFLQQVHSRVIHFRRVCEYEYDMENMCWPAIATPQLMQSDKNVWARLEPSPFIYFKSKAAILRSYAIDAEQHHIGDMHFCHFMTVPKTAIFQ